MLEMITFRMSWRQAVMPFFGIWISLILLAGCSQSPAGASQPSPNGHATVPRVGVLTLRAREVLRATELPGRTSAVLTSEVRPQVSGVVLKRLFTEGADVKEGQQLYQIDPASYQAAYDNAVATLDKSKAALVTAQAKATRYKKLVDADMLSRQDYDDALAIAQETKAEIESGEASVKQARINLEYTKVYSPISGRIGHSSVTPGALVTANQATALATVTQLDPLYVDLNQSSSTLLRLRKEMDAGEIEGLADGAAKVTLKMEDGSLYPITGKLKFTEVTVDQGTGTVLLRAVFPNPSHLLMPGMYVHAIIQEGVNRNGLTVPQAAVRRNTREEAVVLVLEEGNKVGQRVVQTGQAIGDQWVITAGLKAGDKVIVDGLQNIRAGMLVAPVPVADATSAAK
ncbi:MAG: efflux RND transporter periplasmic adaptor subunit [Desulfovibrio sp.]